MSYEEVELLKNRALRMLNHVKQSLVDGDYDISVFMADQATQLYLKSIIFELTGELPRVHMLLRRLLDILKNILGKPNEVDKFIRENRSLLIRLEDAYISSRYLPRRYEEDEVRELVKFAEEVVKFVGNLKGKT